MIEHSIDDGVANITFNKPEKRNCFTASDMHELNLLLEWINAQPGIVIVILRGKGPVFSAGFDISDFMPSIKDRDPFYDVYPSTLFAIRNVGVPTLAVLQGSAYGFGCGLAMSCDFRVAKRGISMAVPTAKMGFCFSPNEILSMTHKMGLPIIKDLLLAGRTIDADRAYQLGIIHKVADTDRELEAEVDDYVADIRKLAPLAVKLGKKAIHHIVRELVPREDEAYQLYYSLYSSEDFMEGVNSFLEKRTPTFKGK
jgi:enoyl-CoA hydratase